MSAKSTAESVLTRVIGNLPPGYWWLLRKSDSDELDIAAAFKRTGFNISNDIDAVFAESSIYKDQMNGFTFKLRLWDQYFDNILKNDNENIHLGTYGKTRYVCNGVPKHECPRLQKTLGDRCTVRTDLPSDLLAEIKQLASSYYNKTKPKEDAAKAIEKAKKIAKKIQYPTLSKYVGNDVDISLKNENVRELANDLLSEIFRLYNIHNETISVDQGDGKEITLVQISRSVNANQYSINDSKNGWVQNVVNASIGGDMSQSEGIDCLRDRLDVLSMNIDPAEKDVSDTDRSDDASDDMSVDESVVTSHSDSDELMITSVLEALDSETSKSTAAEPKDNKRKREEQLEGAARILAPRYKQGHTVEWKDSSVSHSSMTTFKDTKDMLHVVNAISRGDQSRAACAIGRMLSGKSLVKMKDQVKEIICKSDTDTLQLCKLVTDGIRESNEHHKTKGTRTIAAESHVKSSVTACLHKIVKDGHNVSDQSLMDLLSVTRGQISHARGRVKEMLSNKTIVTALERTVRKDMVRRKVLGYVFAFLLDDSYTRLDTKQGLEQVMDPRTGYSSTVHKRIWLITNKRQQHSLFISSDHYQQFQKDHPGATVGYDVWRCALAVVGSFVSKPLQESCVDERMSSLEHFMAAILCVLKWKDVKAELEKYGAAGNNLTYKETYESMRKAGGYQMIEAVCCPKVNQPDLHLDKSEKCPKLIPFKCTHGTDFNKENRCLCCGVTKKLGMLEQLSNMEEAESLVEVMVWQDADRQGAKVGKDGETKQNSQRELTSKEMTVKELITKFKEQVEKCIPHYQEICWIRIVMQANISRLRQNEMLILTDFASVLALRAFQTKNSSVDGHAVNDNFVVLHNRRIVKVRDIEARKKKKDNEVEMQINDEEIVICTVDVHHFFAETISKGKKNDHAMHNICLDAIIRRYQGIFAGRGDTLEHVIVWTDNAPTQYRCRHTFLKVASVVERHPGIKISHRLAVPDNFKGIHDAVGKDPAHLVRSLELVGTRSPTAQKVFENCLKNLEKTQDETAWKQYEADGDDRLKNKGKYGMDSRRVWFVVETKDELDKLDAAFPGRILLCDRTFVLDTHSKTPLDKTVHLHEVCSTATNIPDQHPRVWPCIASYLPCACKHCFVDPANKVCVYAPWRNTHNDNMRIKCVSPEEAVTFIESKVCKKIKKRPYYVMGSVVSFSRKSEQWEVKYDDDKVDHLTYTKLGKEKKYYNDWMLSLEQNKNS